MNIWFRIWGYMGISSCLNLNTFYKEKQCSALESCEKKLLRISKRVFILCMIISENLGLKTEITLIMFLLADEHLSEIMKMLRNEQMLVDASGKTNFQEIYTRSLTRSCRKK